MLRPGPGQLEPLTTTGMMTAVMIAAFIACTALATARARVNEMRLPPGRYAPAGPRARRALAARLTMQQGA